MKRISLILALVLLISSAVASVSYIYAGGSPVISVSNISADPGETVTADISIKNNPGILGMTLKVTFDEDILTLTSVTSGDAMSALTFTPPKNLVSGCKLPFDALEIDQSDIKDGIIATLTFTVSETASAGEKASISISYDDGAIIDNDLNTLEIETVSGSVEIAGNSVFGDVSGDGKVNSRDTLALKRFVAGKSDENDTSKFDLTGDGVVNARDTLKLKLLIVKGE